MHEIVSSVELVWRTAFLILKLDYPEKKKLRLGKYISFTCDETERESEERSYEKYLWFMVTADYATSACS